jgi:hypothetical protein
MRYYIFELNILQAISGQNFQKFDIWSLSNLHKSKTWEVYKNPQSYIIVRT